MAGRGRIKNADVYPLLREYLALSAVQSLTPLGAHAVGIGRKIVNGKKTNELALRVYVARKMPLREIGPRTRVPETIPFFSRKLGRDIGLTTDVIEVPPMQFEGPDPETRIRPVPGGASFGIATAGGTLGGWVWDTTDDTIVMLSNDHVIGAAAGTDIMQPSPNDGGALPADKIGDVKRRIARSSTGTNTVDCAIGDPDDSSVYDLTVLEIGPAVYSVDVAAVDMDVEKMGQTTDHTFGEVDDVDWTGTVSGLSFTDCIYIDAISPSADWSNSGDSGSLVFSQTPIESGSEIKPVVGLHFAGGGTGGVACKIQNVFNRLDLTTLCAGAFAAFLDALFEAESEGEVGTEAEMRLRTISALATGRVPVPLTGFTRRERLRAGGARLHTGISRDIQGRLFESTKGKVVTKFVDANRAELLTLVAKDGDVRRATVAALRPIVAGATTSGDVLARSLTKEDLERLDKLAGILASKGSPKLKAAAKAVTALRPRSAGKSIADLLGLKA